MEGNPQPVEQSDGVTMFFTIMELSQISGVELAGVANLLVQGGFVALFAWFVLYLRRLEMDAQKDWRVSQEQQQKELRAFYEKQTEIQLQAARWQSEMYLQVTREHVAALHELSSAVTRLTDKVTERLDHNTEATNKLVERIPSTRRQ